MTAIASGGGISLTSKTTGQGSDFTLAVTVGYNSTFFSNPSFTATASGPDLTGGANAGLSMSTPFVTLYFYDPLGNLTCVEQHGGVTGTGCSSPTSSDASSPWRVRRFTYDPLSRLLTATNPESGLITYTYDANSNLQTKVAPLPNQASTGTSTVTTNYTYDDLNRLIKKTYLDNGTTADPYTPTVQYEYDAVALTGCTTTPPASNPADIYPIGLRTSMCEGSGGTSWTHDQMGRVLQETRIIGTSASTAKTITYAYNKDGSLYTLTTPPMKTVTYTVGGAGRALSVVDSGDNINFATSAHYAPPGELASVPSSTSAITLGGVINGALNYNSRLQPMQIFYGTNSAPTLTGSTCPSTVGNIMHRAYNFNLGSSDNGNVLSIANCVNTARTSNFTYDGLNRITSGQSSGSGSTSWGEIYSIDPWGNLYSRAPVTGKAYYEPLNVTNTATVKNQLPTFSYDPAGNMTLNNTVSYTYDAENRLVWTSNYRYIYDGDGQRVEKCAVGSASTACPTSGTTGTLYWRGTGSDTLDESDLGGNPQEEYIFFSGMRIARRDVSSTGATIAVHYYFSDHLGTHAVVSNAAGTTLEQDIDYYPYGGQEWDYATAPVAQHYKYNGKERDTESGLDNFGARFDASNLARFMTPDWAAKPTAVPYAHYGNPQSLNLYSYVQNNPTTLGDPDGHAPCNAGRAFADLCDPEPPKAEQTAQALVELDQSKAQDPEQAQKKSKSRPKPKPKKEPSVYVKAESIIDKGTGSAGAERNVFYQAYDANGQKLKNTVITLQEKCKSGACPNIANHPTPETDPANIRDGLFQDDQSVYIREPYTVEKRFMVGNRSAQVLDSSNTPFDYEISHNSFEAGQPFWSEYGNDPNK